MAFDLEKIKEELRKNPWVMLDDLADKIGTAFWIRAEIIKKLLSKKASESLSWLKKELLKEKKLSKTTLSEWNLEKLLTVIAWAKEFITSLSQKEILELKQELKKFSPDDYEKYLTEKYLPKNLILRAKNPQNFPDHITWACLWIVNSAQKVVELLYMIGKWILQTPYHVYIIVSWKGEYKNWKNR